VENSFHTNPRSTEWLLKDDNLKKLAQTQAETIANYFKLTKKEYIPAKTITPESSKEDIKWLQTKLNAVLPNWLPKLKVDGDYGPKTRIGVLVYWDQLGWGKHLRDDGTRAGKSTRQALSEGKKA
jgi:N-acetylmuramoyl-L-alanine amidase